MPLRDDEQVDIMTRRARARAHSRIATLPLSAAVRFVVEDLDPAAARRFDVRLQPTNGQAALDLSAIQSIYIGRDLRSDSLR